MIRLHRGPAPAIFSSRRCQDERARLEREADDCLRRGEPVPKFEFKDSLYNHKKTRSQPAVKKVLCDTQNSKCCYCEGRITPTAYGAIEHFRPKSAWRQRPQDPDSPHGYYWLAYEWDNLLLSCEVCNSSHKKTLFPITNARTRARDHHMGCAAERPLLIDPYTEDPGVSLEFIGASAVHRNPRGYTTIRTLGLNRNELVSERERLTQTLDDLCRLIRFFIARHQDEPPVELCDMLHRHCACDAPYSSTARCYIARSYPDLRARLGLP